MCEPFTALQNTSVMDLYQLIALIRVTWFERLLRSNCFDEKLCDNSLFIQLIGVLV